MLIVGSRGYGGFARADLAQCRCSASQAGNGSA
jgi:hypothetical protein